MRNYLVPLDFSENSSQVVSVAKQLAGKYGSTLLLLHAYQPSVPDMTVPSGVGMANLGSDLGIEEHYRTRLEKIASDLESEGYSADVIWSPGGIHGAIQEAIGKYHPEMVIMGRSGEGGFLDRLMGSSATTIGLDAGCPVLVVPSSADAGQFKEVVYATQLEYEEGDVLSRALPLLNSLGARVTFLKVNSRAQPNIQSDEQYRQQIMQQHSIGAGSFVTREADSVLEGIEDYCREVNADLLVMATRRRGFLEAFITNPSVTKKMIVETHLPLLVYHLAAE